MTRDISPGHKILEWVLSRCLLVGEHWKACGPCEATDVRSFELGVARSHAGLGVTRLSSWSETRRTCSSGLSSGSGRPPGRQNRLTEELKRCLGPGKGSVPENEKPPLGARIWPVVGFCFRLLPPSSDRQQRASAVWWLRHRPRLQAVAANGRKRFLRMKAGGSRASWRALRARRVPGEPNSAIKKPPGEGGLLLFK